MMAKKAAAVLFAVAVFVISGSAAKAYRPFDGTDAAVAQTGEMEIELGPVEYLRDGSERTLFAPDVRINYGFTPRWEAVLEACSLMGLPPGFPETACLKTAPF